eukprot:8013602-Pyramimonas_sp.AAC.1
MQATWGVFGAVVHQWGPERFWRCLGMLLCGSVFRVPVGVLPLEGWLRVQSWGGVRAPLLAHACLAALVRAA